MIFFGSAARLPRLIARALHINKFACRKENPTGRRKYLYKVLSVLINRSNPIFLIVG